MRICEMAEYEVGKTVSILTCIYTFSSSISFSTRFIPNSFTSTEQVSAPCDKGTFFFLRERIMFWKAPLSWKWSRKGKKEFSWQFAASRDQSRVISLESEASRCFCLGQPVDRRSRRDPHSRLHISITWRVFKTPNALAAHEVNEITRQGGVSVGSSGEQLFLHLDTISARSAGWSWSLRGPSRAGGAVYHIPRRLTGSSNRTQAERPPIWSLFLNRLVPREERQDHRICWFGRTSYDLWGNIKHISLCFHNRFAWARFQTHFHYFTLNQVLWIRAWSKSAPTWNTVLFFRLFLQAYWTTDCVTIAWHCLIACNWEHYSSFCFLLLFHWSSTQ